MAGTAASRGHGSQCQGLGGAARNSGVLCGAQVAGLQRAAQYGAPVTPESVASLRACLRGIWVREGLRGLYKGALPSCLKSAPATAVTFATYELCIRALLRAGATAAAAKDSNQS